MAYKQTIYDDFNDNSFSTTKWTVTAGGSYITESSQRLNVASNAQYSYFYSQNLWDIRDGIVAMKLSRSGTTGTDGGWPVDELNIMTEDSTGNGVGAYFTPHAGDYSSSSWGDASVGGEELFEANVFGPSWTNGTWFGIGGVRWNGANTNWAHLYKSTDGITWTRLARFDIYSIDTSNVRLVISLGRWATGGSTFAIQLDDVSYFEYRSKVRVGGAWVNAKPKVRVGGAWVNARPVARSGGAWEALR